MKRYEEDICIHKGDFLIVKTKEIEFNNPTVFVTFPTPGIVGPIIARQMISSLGLEEIGFFKSDSLNPVTIFIEICNLYDIKYDKYSTSRSSNIYELNSVELDADVVLPDTTILSFFEALAQVSCASIYSVGDRLYYEVYEDRIATEVVYEFDTSPENRLYMLSSPVIGPLSSLSAV